MITSSINPSMAALRAPTVPVDSGFTSALGRVSATTDSGKIRQAAEQLVATSLVQPILASLTKSPFQEGIFAPGPIEERFTPLLHRHLSDRIVSSSNFGLVDVLTDRLSPRPGIEVIA
ncbi:MAG: hypothetical protein MK116_04375 [Phycisphaerales bacterium]|nr:hypothetical protein [Phycisphaerales bacterium]